MNRMPDFFLVGAPKCGTTALYEMLGAHPEIFVSPIKEPDFFASDIRHAAHPAGAVDDWSQYLQLFHGAAASQQLGEGSVSYLASRVAATAIHDRCPSARILMVLRDPADRLFAHYRAAVASDSTRAKFPDWLDGVVKKEQTDSAPIGAVAAGRYGVTVKRYLNVFPRPQVHIVWHEDFVNEPAAAVRGIFQFLGVDETREVPVTIRRNETRTVRSSLPLQATASDRARAIQVYEPDIRALADLTGRDLSHWTRVTG
jgi:hypothetical protein